MHAACLTLFVPLLPLPLLPTAARLLLVNSCAWRVYGLSDHGEMHLEHRHVEKMTHYEGSARVPLIIAGPGVPAAGRTETSLVSLLDIFPTFVDLAGVDPAAEP